MLLRDLRIQTVFQLVIAAALVAGTVFYWQIPFPDLTKRPAQSWQPKLAVKVSVEELNRSSTVLDQALRRPIFRSSRRPFEPAQVLIVAQPTAPPSPPEQLANIAPDPLVTVEMSQLVLKGIAINTAKQLALIANPDSPEGAWLTIGDVVSGWKIRSIDKNSIHLTIDNQEAVLLLYVDNPAKPVGSPK